MRVICFDLGGVIVRICLDWEEAARRAGLPAPRSSSFQSHPLVHRRMELLALHQRGAIACSEFFDGLALASDGNYSPAEVAAIHEAWLIGDYEGMAKFVDELNQRPQFTTACLSNTNENHWKTLTNSNGNSPLSATVNKFKHQFASHQLGLVKPDAAIFSHFEASMKARPEEIIFYDDTPENIAAAKARGWEAVLIDPGCSPVTQMRRHLSEAGLWTNSHRNLRSLRYNHAHGPH